MSWRAGFSAEVDPAESSIEYGFVPEDQHGAFMAAEEACNQESGHPRLEPLTEDQIRDFYRALLQAKQRLEDQGYAVSESPSDPVPRVGR